MLSSTRDDLGSAAGDLELAHELADLADSITVRHVAAGPVTWQSKSDGSPVTAVDVEVEESLSTLVASRRPQDAFLGEEVGSIGTGQRRWIVDGIDGTRAFVAGLKQWGTLVALEVEGAVALGVASSPALGQRWWAAQGQGAWSSALGSGLAGRRRLRATSRAWSSTSRLAVDPPVEECQGWRRRVAQSALTAGSPMTLTDHPALMVAAGQLELSLHLGGGPWDHAPFVVIVEEAGGCFSDLWGGRRLDTSTAVFASRSETLADLIEQVAVDRPTRPGD